jgi:hypothetical protein
MKLQVTKQLHEIFLDIYVVKLTVLNKGLRHWLLFNDWKYKGGLALSSPFLNYCSLLNNSDAKIA